MENKEESKEFYLALYNKINNALYKTKISKQRIAKELNITKTAFSLQLRNLQKGNGINIETVRIIEKLTKENFFCL